MSIPQPLGLEPSFGFGDRLGLASPGHIEAMRREPSPIRGIFAQQSIREMTRTNRTPTEVMSAAATALQEAGYEGSCGADADHLKTEGDVDITAAAGFVFFTIDPSDHVDERADDYDHDALLSRYEDDVPAWVGHYMGQTVQVPEGPQIHFAKETVQRAVVKYGRAIKHTLKLAAYIDSVMTAKGSDYEIELSVDETPQPTTLAEHYIIADQCRVAEIKLVSLAPRYVGDFEKGIDYKGDISVFEASLKDHAAIARAMGPYKLSLHSGSDKLSIYETFARITGGLFHVKTAGTSYLEAVRVAAREDEPLFRRIVGFSRNRFDEDKATYHISATLHKVASADEVSDSSELERLYLDEDDGRQILHVTFGSVLTDSEHGPALRAVLEANPETHCDVVASHLAKHLAELKKGMPDYSGSL